MSKLIKLGQIISIPYTASDEESYYTAYQYYIALRDFDMHDVMTKFSRKHAYNKYKFLCYLFDNKFIRNIEEDVDTVVVDLESRNTMTPIWHNLMRTFNEWKDMGYGVIKGQKSHRVNGECLFTKDQVTPCNNRTYYTDDYDYDDLYFWDDFH